MGIDSAIGHFLVGVLLDVMAFPRGAQPEDINPQSLWTLGLVDGPLAIIPGVIAAFFYGRYAIDRRRYDETRRQLDAVRAQRSAQPAAARNDLSGEETTAITT